jgi:thiosulfate/3-mercaptopyruvate sulfurtransferase
VKALAEALVPADQLAGHVGDPRWVIVDCRFRLLDPGFGREAYTQAHLPGAVYADLNRDLSGPVIAGRTGRHPLPDVASLARTLSAWGVDASVQVVAYDDSGGSMAARLWWLLRWLGHRAVAVLDGGWPAWVAAGLPVESEVPSRKPRPFEPQSRTELVADAEVVNRIRQDPGWRLLDARAAERFRGEHETIDPVAGHIPGAYSAPYAENLDAGGRFLPPEQLRRRYADLLGAVPADRCVCYCGSGVTAAHDVLAMFRAGLGEAKLYPGSWSEWILDPRRPVAKD